MQLMTDPNHFYYAHRNEVNWLRNPVNVAAPYRFTPLALDAEFEREDDGGTITAPTAGQQRIDQDAQTPVGAPIQFPGAEAPTSGIEPGAIIDGEAVTVRRAPVYPDQIFPFDITLVARIGSFVSNCWNILRALGTKTMVTIQEIGQSAAKHACYA